jgi:uncharacterized membrane protein (UPF0127 family)
MMMQIARRMTLPVMALLFIFLASVNTAQADMPKVKIGENVIKLEVASTPEAIERGLMYRTSIAEDNGMVFLFVPPRPVKFWMYHTLIPLDMCFIYEGKIVKIFEDVPPCHSTNPTDCPTYPKEDPGILVTEVVELKGGYAKRHNIKEGDKVEFDLPVL